jgi:hypothetical protein
MSVFGKILLHAGLALRLTAQSSNTLTHKIGAEPTASWVATWPNNPPGASNLLTMATDGTISYTAANSLGTVSSVALALPSFLTVSGSPVTTSGTLTATLASQAANTLLIAPNGSAGSPTFRVLASADIPSLLATKISDFDTQVRTSRIDQLAIAGANVNLNGFKITGAADPTNAQDLVTKIYADALVTTGTNKGAARFASNGINISIASPPSSLDGGTPAVNDIVLIKDNTASAENGLYVWNGPGVPLTRTTNADTSAEVRTGLFVFVSEGTSNASQGYTLVTPAPITLGTTGLTFNQTSGAGQINAGSGLTKTGNTLDAIGTANRITVLADNIDISSTYVGQSSLTTLGTITTGVWNGSPVPVANGGTGAVTASAARTALGAPGVFVGSFTNASLVAGMLTIAHGLNNQWPTVQLYDNTNKLVNPDEVIGTNTTNLSVDFSTFGTLTGTWRYTVVG